MPPASPNEDIRQSTLLRKAIRTLCTVVYLLLIGIEGAEEAVQQCRDLYAVVSSEGAELPDNWHLDPCRWATTSKLGTLHPLYFVLVARTHGLLAARTDMHSSVRDTSDAILVHLAPLSRTYNLSRPIDPRL